MADNASFSAFPRNKIEALAALYMQSQDLTDKSPEDLAVMYSETYAKIKEKFRDLRHDDDWFK